MRRLLQLITCLWLAVPWFADGKDLPISPTPHYIHDEAGWLSASNFKSLDARLQAFERESSSQLLVAIFPRIPERKDLLGFSQEVFEHWNPGQAGKDNGAILFIFAADRKLRIQTGYGMEGVLPDARCKQIIDDVITPYLKAGNRNEAVTKGIDAMISAAKGEYVGTGRTNLDSKRKNPPFQLIIIVIAVLWGLISMWRNKDTVITGDGYNDGGWGSSGGGWGGGFGSGGSFGGGGGFSGGGGSSGGGGASGGW